MRKIPIAFNREGQLKYTKVKKINRATGEPCGFRWQFTKYNPKTQINERVPVKAIPKHIRNSQDESEVEAYCKSQDAIDQTARHRAKLRIEWRKKYDDYNKLLEDFSTYQAERAPNSYLNDVYYLEQYAFHFFLTKKENNTYWQWYLHFDEFRKWLKTEKPAKWNRETLSLNTQNRIIKALNVFLGMVAKANDKNIPRCQHYKRDELNQITSLDILSEEEVMIISKELREISPLSCDFFIVLARTGMRENEALGLALSFLSEGNIQGAKLDKLHSHIKRYPFPEYYGYICLESQPQLKSIRTKEKFCDRLGTTWEVGSVPRKPLKLRKKISPENYRFIPIFDKEAWNILVDRWNAQQEKKERNAHGEDLRNYLLFDTLTASIFYNDLKEAYRRASLIFKSPHMNRHFFLTWFYECCDSDRFLAKVISGHIDERSIENYSHLRDFIGREQQAKKQATTKMKRLS